MVNGDKNGDWESLITQTEFKEVPRKYFKDIGINCAVITRDIGTGYTPVVNRSVATNTIKNSKDAETTTEIQNDTKFNLEQILRKSKFVTTGTQTISKITTLEIIEKRDRGIQTVDNLSPKRMYEYFKNRSIGSSTDLPFRNEFEPITENPRSYSKYCQTKDVIIKERVFLKKTGSQTDLTMQKYKDTGINTIRKKMVDASCGESIVQEIICEKCHNIKTNTNQSVSKIPRPRNIPINAHSNKKKLLMRQDTYVTIPSPELEKLKELQKKEFSEHW